MHKAIASLFIDITGLLHLLVAGAFAFVVYQVTNAGIQVDQLNGYTSTQVIWGVAICIAVYVLVFGFLSVFIRMHQNLDKMTKTLDRMSQTQDDMMELLSDVYTEEEAEEPEQVMPQAVTAAPARTASTTAMRQEPVLRKPST